MSEKIEEQLLRDTLARLAYTSGLALGLANRERWDEVYKVVEGNRAFWEAAKLVLHDAEVSDERKEK